jgi:CheY-like chemotaxis protein
MLSLKEKFEEDGYQVISVNADIDALSKTDEDICAILVYGDEQLLEKDRWPALVYVKDQAAERDVPVFVTGSPDELEELDGVLGGPVVRQKFTRPLNVHDMVDSINSYVEKFGSDNKKKILVVDDSGAMLRNVKGWLEDHYQVILANSGAMAIKYLAVNRPDLVLLDYEMPIVDGKQVLQMIRAEKEFADMPVIFLTSKDDKESVMQVMSLKPEGYLLKTMEPAKIVQTVDDFFEKQKGMVHA